MWRPSALREADRTRLVAGLAALSIAVVATRAGAQPPPSVLYGPLFTAVQAERSFADSKTFADAAPRRAPAAIVADFKRQRPTGEALRAFVLANFVVPGVNDPADLRDHIRALWPQLTREPAEPPRGGSVLPLRFPYVVPGGRFQEIYYWDSYFTMLGLKADGRQPLVESMLDDFTDLIDRYGHIPNGTRSYYLSRSQPPFFALMLDLSTAPDRRTRARRLAAVRREHAYWMSGAACAAVGGACLRVVRMPDGSLLNRYYDDLATPRDEAYAEDSAQAARAAPRPARQVYRDIRAAAESGWDFSSRWLRDQRTLETIHTTDIVPIDLNSLLWAMERRIASLCAAAADRSCAREFAGEAQHRKAAIDRFLWRPDEGRYADWDLSASAPTGVLSAATLTPLFVGLSTPAQADRVAATTRALLVAPGGVRTTTVWTGQQWDEPNGWAPLQWMAIEGLSRTGHTDLAREIACRWLGTVTAAYSATGRMLEKYDVERHAPGGGGEYPVQDGFGWTNGVTSAVLARFSAAPSAWAPCAASAAEPGPASPQ